MPITDERAAQIAEREPLTDATLDEIEQRARRHYPEKGYAERSAREIAMVHEIRRWREIAGARLLLNWKQAFDRGTYEEEYQR